MLGVIIGVASVIALVAVGQGATAGITSRLEVARDEPADDRAGCLAHRRARGARGVGDDAHRRRRDGDRPLDTVAAVEPELTTQAVIIAGVNNTTTSIVGTTPDYLAVRNFTIWQGSFLTDVAVDQALRVAVLGATTADDLGLDATSVGSDDPDPRAAVRGHRHPAAQGRRRASPTRTTRCSSR